MVYHDLDVPVDVFTHFDVADKIKPVLVLFRNLDFQRVRMGAISRQAAQLAPSLQDSIRMGRCSLVLGHIWLQFEQLKQLDLLGAVLAGLEQLCGIHFVVLADSVQNRLAHHCKGKSLQSEPKLLILDQITENWNEFGD